MIRCKTLLNSNLLHYSVEVLQWMRAQGCEWTVCTTTFAALHGGEVLVASIKTRVESACGNSAGSKYMIIRFQREGCEYPNTC